MCPFSVLNSLLSEYLYAHLFQIMTRTLALLQYYWAIFLFWGEEVVGPCSIYLIPYPNV